MDIIGTTVENAHGTRYVVVEVCWANMGPFISATPPLACVRLWGGEYTDDEGVLIPFASFASGFTRVDP